jgi:hypothetical protein
MEYFEAYKYIPRRGNIVRLYEFRGRFYSELTAADHPEPLLTPMPRSKHILVMAENFIDATVVLNKRNPMFFADQARCLAILKLEQDQKVVPLPASSDASVRELEESAHPEGS